MGTSLVCDEESQCDKEPHFRGGNGFSKKSRLQQDEVSRLVHKL